jgi:endonuclease/exonuclease/phosphatase family metal-dependent hydrolase
MKRITICILLFSFVIFCKSPSEESISSSNIVKKEHFSIPDTFSVAFYNVENLFDANDNGTEYPEFKKSAGCWNSILSGKKLNNISRAIAALDASIVGLCEVENMDVLKLLQKSLKNKDCDYPYSAFSDNSDGSSTNTAILSRFPLKNIRILPVKIDTLVSRCILETDIDLQKSSLKVFVNHWPSKTHPESYRIKTAEILLSRLKQLKPGTDYIVIGDLNSDYNEVNIFTRSKLNDSNGKTGLNNILGTVYNSNKETNFTTEDRLRNGSGGMFDLWLELDSHNRMSHVFSHKPWTPDHILLPASLYDSSGISYCDNSFEAFNWNGKLLNNSVPFRWQAKWINNKKVFTGEGYSDHLPVIAKFTFGPFVPKISLSQNYTGQRKSTQEITGFEEKSENWISITPKVKLQFDSTTSASGRYSLKITSNDIEKNCTVLRIPFSSGQKMSGKRYLQFKLKGSGSISFRIRSSGKDWVYYNPENFSISKSARYNTWQSEKWSNIRLSLPEEIFKLQEQEFEIRAGKNKPLNIWIDNIYLSN